MSRLPTELVELRRELGRSLARLREESTIDQSDLGRITHYSRTSISHIEAGRQFPKRPFWEAADHAFHADGALLALYDEVVEHERQWKLAELQGEQLRPYEFRALTSSQAVERSNVSDTSITGTVALFAGQTALRVDSPAARNPRSAVLAAGVEWLTLPAEPHVLSRVSGDDLDLDFIDLLETRVLQLRKLDDAHGASRVLDWVDRELVGALELAQNSAYGRSTGRRLYGVIAELGQLAGWVAGDLGRLRESQQYLLMALRAAHLCGSRELGAYILSCLSYFATWAGYTREALQLIGLARHGVPTRSSGTVQALLATRQARAYARKGDAIGCDRALGEAYELHHQTTVEPGELAWSYWINTAVLTGDAGRAWLDLGRHDRAEDSLTRGLALLNDSQPRNRLLHNTSLAEARLASNNIDGAVDAVSRALDAAQKISSERGRNRLRKLLPAIAAANAADSKQITTRITSVLSINENAH